MRGAGNRARTGRMLRRGMLLRPGLQACGGAAGCVGIGRGAGRADLLRPGEGRCARGGARGRLWAAREACCPVRSGDSLPAASDAANGVRDSPERDGAVGAPLAPGPRAGLAPSGAPWGRRRHRGYGGVGRGGAGASPAAGPARGGPLMTAPRGEPSRAHLRGPRPPPKLISEKPALLTASTVAATSP